MSGSFDLKVTIEIVKQIAIGLIKIPFELWYQVPIWIKVSLTVIIGVFSIFILIIVLINKKKWMYKKF
jgi:hypothetical protein